MSFLKQHKHKVLVAAGVVAVAVVGIVVLIQTSTPHNVSSPKARSGCAPSGCAQVSLSRSLPPVTVFYGASCSGPSGTWFLNAVEGGGNDQLRPSYALRWSFAPGSKMASPSGQVTVASTSTTDVTITINDGALTIKGTRKPGVNVSKSGTLQVELTGTSSAPTLTFTETGLTQAEKDLGLVSPFNAGGQPLVVPIKTVKTLAGC